MGAMRPEPHSMNRKAPRSTRRSASELRAKRKPARMAPSMCSAGSTAGTRSRRQARSTATTAKKESASNTNTKPDPTVATTSPPRAGPTVRATLTPTPLSVTPSASSSLGRSSGTIECQAGSFSAVAIPSAKASASNIQGVTMPVKVTTASAPTAIAMAICVTTSSQRRSTMSASAPAGSPRKKKGRLSAVSSNDTMSGDGVSDVISQPWPTSVMYEPMCEATEAIHRARKCE